MRPLNRITPQLPAAAFKTYQVAAPLPTHWRPATCEEAGCPAHEYGWRTLVDETSELGRRQAHYIRRQSGRKFVEDRDAEGLTVFMFEPGQTCFQPHQVPLEREPLYLVRGGDWRGDPLGGRPYQHRSAEAWLDDFATHQDRLADRLRRG